MRAGDMLTAQGAYVSALESDSRCLDAWINLSVIFISTGRESAALGAAKRAVDVAPDSSECWNNFGYILGCVGNFAGGKEALNKAKSIKNSYQISFNLGLCYYSLGMFKESVDAFDEALKYAPGDVEATDKRAISLLGIGEYREGLLDNKIRWNVLAPHPLMHSDIPEWCGEPLTGKSIVVLHEQGFGDTFQFVRFVPKLRNLGVSKVILSVPSSVSEVLAGLADEIIGIRDIPKDVDYKCPMMTVPAHLDVTLDSVPCDPYIKYSSKYGLPDDGRFKVGIVWAGKPMYAQDRWRSMPVDTLFPLITAFENITFYSLQADERSSDLWKSGAIAFCTDLGPHIKDWSTTASIINELDLVVSVDTAVAHLAGAMGKPVALMLPEASCWRWLDHASTVTPWYSSMRLFRQSNQGDWKNVIDGVSNYIKGMGCRPLNDA